LPRTLPHETSKEFVRDAHGTVLPIIENFYNYCAEHRLMGVTCVNCGEVMCPPRTLCRRCLGDKHEWVEFKGRAKLITYTIIHFPPTQFQLLAPYAVGIARLDEGPHLPGMIKSVKLDEIHVGMQLQFDYEVAVPKDWPRWARYFFKPVLWAR
jgi:hypothetical protein